MSETDSFVDPVFLARFGLSRVNVVDYFLHPLNPFRSKVNTSISNEVLAMQGIGIGMLMAHGVHNEGPMTPMAAEEEYNKALSRLTGEQYELLPPTVPKHPDPNNPAAPIPTLHQLYTMPSPLYSIRHVLRTSPTSIKVLGIYYVVEGVIYKSPTVRSLMKTNVARCALEGLHGACRALAVCARFQPAIGYTWVFDAKDDNIDNEEDSEDQSKPNVDVDDDDEDPVALERLVKRRKLRHRNIRDHRRPGQRTAAEEEGIRASEAMDQILVRISKSLRAQQQQQKTKVAASATTLSEATAPPSMESSRRNSLT